VQQKTAFPAFQNMKKTLLIIAGTSGLLAFSAQAQARLTIPELSPATHIRQAFSTSYIDLKYARPSLRGREVFGNVEPYGSVWRTGANSITKVRFGEEVTIDGQAVPAGTYALLTIPGKQEWTFILNRDTAQWGAYDYSAAKDVLRAKAKPVRLADRIESMSLTVENVRPATADLVLAWDQTKVTLPIKANPDLIVMAQITEAMKGEKKPYLTAAQYYYDNGKDLNQAVAWLDEFIKTQPNEYYGYYWKAKLLHKQGKNKDAIEAATRSLALTKDEKNETARTEYIRLNQLLLAEAGGKK
jgi:tetratricopeptide (TPR) repeat protein